jgi:hypothetical protein
VPVISYFFWTWHWRTPHSLAKLCLRRFNVDSETQITKTRALSKYHSQLVHDGGEPILPESLLKPARRSFEIFLVANV